jgi:membrane glycosyltransferase
MIVLDADSIMAPQTLVALVARMQADAQLGILQTVPMLIGHWSLFSRIQQFAGRVYGSSIGRGVAAWSGNEGNFWGHNAIIRVAAFAQACGLPQLPGRKPFGGHVMSHDFVEAALIRRAGWKVRMAPDLGGSWEESPPSLVDIAIRDRRWAQGNMQHAKIVDAKGLAVTSRAHFIIGIMSYLSSPLWMMLLLVGFALTLQATLIRPEYFSRSFQLFPDWPRFDAPRMTALFIYTMVVLFTPKILGLVRTIFSNRARRGCGGIIALAIGAVVETILSALYAPIMMLVQTQHIIEIFTGRDSGWTAQRRHAHMTSWSEAWNFHWPHLVMGFVIGGIAFPDFADAARLADADARRSVPGGPAVQDQRQRQARSLPELVPRAAHAGRKARAACDPAARRVVGTFIVDTDGRLALYREESAGAFRPRVGQPAAPAGNPRTP